MITIAIARGTIRQRLKKRVEDLGYQLINVIHPTAFYQVCYSLKTTPFRNFVTSNIIIFSVDFNFLRINRIE